jgi:phosphopantothenate synthetase
MRTTRAAKTVRSMTIMDQFIETHPELIAAYVAAQKAVRRAWDEAVEYSDLRFYSDIISHLQHRLETDEFLRSAAEADD